MELNSIAPIGNNIQPIPINTTPNVPIAAVTNTVVQSLSTTNAPAAGTGGSARHMLRSARRQTLHQRLTTTISSTNAQQNNEKAAVKLGFSIGKRQANPKEETPTRSIFHTHSIGAAGTAMHANPGLQVDVLFAADRQECLNVSLDEENVQSQTLWMGDIVNDATHTHARIERVNYSGLASIVGHAAQHQDCFQTVSAETSHLPSHQASIRKYSQDVKQAQLVKDAEDTVLGLCSNDPNAEKKGIKPCHPKHRYQPPENSVHTKAQDACAKEVVIVSDGLFGEDIEPYVARVTTFGEPKKLENGFTIRAHTTNTTTPSDGSADFNRASNYARSALRRCPDTRFHDVRATEGVPAQATDPTAAKAVAKKAQPQILTSQMLLQALDQVIQLGDLPQNIVLLEPLELPDYHPDFLVLEQAIKALMQQGVKISSYAGSEISWLHRIEGVETMERISDGLVPLVPSLPVHEAILSGVSAFIIAAIFGCFGIGLCVKRQRSAARRNAGMNEPLLPTQIRQGQGFENQAFLDDESTLGRAEEGLSDREKRRRRSVLSQAQAFEMQPMCSQESQSE